VSKPKFARDVRSVLLLLVALLAVPGGAVAAERSERTLRWSGYRWVVRSTTTRADPGHNLWGDSRWNARARRDGTLRLNISRGKAVEIIGPPTGYGRYRWVVETDVRTVDPFRVIAFFVRGTGGEQDIEFSRWGDPNLTTVGTWVTWRRRTRLAYAFFPVPGPPPYTVQIDWRPSGTSYRVRDRTGVLCLDTWYATSGAGRHVAPRISYWLYPGHGLTRSPFTRTSVHPPVIVRSFSFHKLRR
jgi:hypothetical protein